MDLLSLYQLRAAAPLGDFAQLMGLPGKLGMEGAGVWGAYQAGKIADIRNYCEADVVNTYLVYLRFQLMRGALTDQQYKTESDVVRSTLKKSAESHWKEFLAKWRA
jgi:predicted PolB exonuclease-like 3'-5' exonuclease